MFSTTVRGYGLTIRDMNQPILYSKPKRRDIRRGMAENIALIPELCVMTGSKDSQRQNFQLMRTLSDQLKLNPTQRVKQIQGFDSTLEQNQVIEKFLVPAGLQMGKELVRLDGHTLPTETIKFGNQREAKMELTDYDWTRALYCKCLYVHLIQNRHLTFKLFQLTGCVKRWT